jgi:hypothetical protein
MALPRGQPIEIFISYAHEDMKYLEALDLRLQALERQGKIAIWKDLDIGAGEKWAEAIRDHLESASVFLLLVSDYFLASEYCYGTEMQRALERHDAGEARVIPILLSKSEWEGSPLGRLQALPAGAKPVTDWKPQRNGIDSILDGLKKVIADLVAGAEAPGAVQVAGAAGEVEIRMRRESREPEPSPRETATNTTKAASAPERVYVGLSRLRELEAQQTKLDSYVHLYIELESSHRLGRARGLVLQIRHFRAMKNGELSEGFWEEVETELDQIDPLGEPSWLHALPQDVTGRAAEFDEHLARATSLLRKIMTPTPTLDRDTASQELLGALYGVRDASKQLLETSRQAAEDCVRNIGYLVKSIIALVPSGDEAQQEWRQDPAVLERYAAAVTSTKREGGSSESGSTDWGSSDWEKATVRRTS